MNNTRTLVIPDIHGRYRQLITLLAHAQYQPETDRIISLGDSINYGDDAKSVVEFLLQTKTCNPNNLYLSGNHEAVVVREWLGVSKLARIPLVTDATVASYGRDLDEAADRSRRIKCGDDVRGFIEWVFPIVHLRFFGSLIPYTLHDRILISHAGPTRGMAIEDHHPEQYYWGDRHWARKRPMDDAPVAICGHWHHERPVISHKKLMLATWPGLYALILQGTEMIIMDDAGKRFDLLPEWIGL